MRIIVNILHSSKIIAFECSKSDYENNSQYTAFK